MFVLRIRDDEMKNIIDIEQSKPSIPSIKFEKFIMEVPIKIKIINTIELEVNSIWLLAKCNTAKTVTNWTINLDKDFKEK